MNKIIPLPKPWPIPDIGSYEGYSSDSEVEPYCITTDLRAYLDELDKKK